MSPKSLKLFAAAVGLLAAAVVLPAQGFARNAGNDPNLIERVDQFIYKPAPGDLLLKPKPKSRSKKKLSRMNRL
jgi:hypothetical protein